MLGPPKRILPVSQNVPGHVDPLCLELHGADAGELVSYVCASSERWAGCGWEWGECWRDVEERVRAEEGWGEGQAPAHGPPPFMR